MKTINQSYTRERRIKISNELRSLSELKAPTYWAIKATLVTKIYIFKTMNGAHSFLEFGVRNAVNIDDYKGGRDAYIRESLTRLANELEQCK